MNRYRCVKVVRAMRTSMVIQQEDGTAELKGRQGDSVVVGADFMSTHDPDEGGFYVVDGRGVETFVPAQEFGEDYREV